MKTNSNTPIKQSFFNYMAPSFDVHVRESIPLFNEAIENFRANVLFYQNLCHIGSKKDISILDLCGSTGKLGADLFNEGYKGSYYNLDGSPQMIEISKQYDKESNRFKSILGGYLASWTDESGQYINEIDINTLQADNFTFACEILGFQFFTTTRLKEIQTMKEKADYCFFVEKFSHPDKEIFAENERLKDTLHKSQFFTENQIQEKKEKVLIDMGDYCTDYYNFRTFLHSTFKNYRQVYKAGNFAGYICSDLPIDWYNVDSQLINNQFNAVV